jgi:DNA (cytosine-5)-methyltransferase 1
VNYLSVCAGIEAATVAWHPLGWKPVLYSEIEKFPRKVLRHHYPTVPLWGDFTAIRPRFLRRLGIALPDILVGGTPCQAFSLAGARLSLADARGNLTLSFVRLAHALANTGRLRNAVWENVPGVLSTADNAFGCFLGALVGADDAIQPPAGGTWPNVGMVSGPRARLAWRVFDAQFFGLAQRRRRVFVVVDFGNGADPAAVLFERLGLQGNSAPRREATESVAAAVTASLGGVSGKDAIDGRVATWTAQVSPTLRAGGNATGGHRPPGTDVDTVETLQVTTFAPEIARCVATREGSSQDFESTTMIAHTLRGEGFDASEDGTGRGTPIVPVIAFDARQTDVCVFGDITGPIDTKQPGPAIAFDAYNQAASDVSHTLRRSAGAMSDAIPQTVTDMAVRRLTPRECERLQGFEDDYTLIAANTPDGHRYKALGNSMAVPCMAWIGRRIAENMPAANDNGRTAGRDAA